MTSVSNKKTFTEPVFNLSAHLEWIWEELVFGVSRDEDWHAAEAIVLDEMRCHEPELRRQGEAALARLGERYLLSRSEVEPQTYIRVAAGDIEIVGRFVTAVRGARIAKDQITRGVLERLAGDGIALAYTTYSVSVGRESSHMPDNGRGRGAPPSAA